MWPSFVPKMTCSSPVSSKTRQMEDTPNGADQTHQAFRDQSNTTTRSLMLDPALGTAQSHSALENDAAAHECRIILALTPSGRMRSQRSSACTGSEPL